MLNCQTGVIHPLPMVGHVVYHVMVYWGLPFPLYSRYRRRCLTVKQKILTTFGVCNSKLFLFRPSRARRSTKNASSASTVVDPPEEVNSSVYTKQFAHSKTQQYRKLKSEWRSNVLLGRSRIQVNHLVV